MREKIKNIKETNFFLKKLNFLKQMFDFFKTVCYNRQNEQIFVFFGGKEVSNERNNGDPKKDL